MYTTSTQRSLQGVWRMLLTVWLPTENVEEKSFRACCKHHAVRQQEVVARAGGFSSQNCQAFNRTIFPY
jgi:hypothetical protein